MNSHLEPRLLEGYRQRTLDAAALLAADDHLATCAECRTQAAAGTSAIRQLRQSLEPSHLSEPMLEAYAEDRLSDPEALTHLQECIRCREEAEDLHRFAQTGLLQTRIQEAPVSRWRAWWPMAAAVAVCAGAIIGVVLWRAAHQGANVPNQFASSAALPDDLRKLRDDAVSSGRVAIPAPVAALQGPRETQLGRAATALVELESPVGTGTLSARPEFRWKPVPRAESYEVSIFDQDLRTVESSGKLKQPFWTPSANLEDGKTYVWELTILIDGKRQTEPRPPAPQARFLVIPEADRRRLADIAARFPQDHVLLGIVYANAGALADAKREWQAAVAAGHPEASRLLANF